MRKSNALIVWERDDWHCRYCGQEVVYEPRTSRRGDRPLSNTATVDHLVLRSEGGTRAIDNLVTACWGCNHDRGDLSVRDFVLGNPDSRHAQKANGRLLKRLAHVGDTDYALSVPLDGVLTPYDPEGRVAPMTDLYVTIAPPDTDDDPADIHWTVSGDFSVEETDYQDGRSNFDVEAAVMGIMPEGGELFYDSEGGCFYAYTTSEALAEKVVVVLERVLNQPIIRGPLPVEEVQSSGVEAAIELAVRYGGIDGDHHKAWVIDQMVRALAGERYEEIVAAACDGEYGPDTYDWDEGTPP